MMKALPYTSKLLRINLLYGSVYSGYQQMKITGYYSHGNRYNHIIHDNQAGYTHNPHHPGADNKCMQFLQNAYRNYLINEADNPWI
jgi:hypothetical protein